METWVQVTTGGSAAQDNRARQQGRTGQQDRTGPRVGQGKSRRFGYGTNSVRKRFICRLLAGITILEVLQLPCGT
eukprot:763133-Hanusia_phi.AAC.3